MHEKLFNEINRFVSLTSQQQIDLCRVTRYQELYKNDVLLEQGQVANHIHFIVEGIVRGVYYGNGKEVTSWFGFEGDFVNSSLSFITRQPSQESIVLISNCKLLSVSHENLQYLYSKDPIWDKLSRIMIEHSYIDVRERLMSFLCQTAKERYDYLLKKNPDIEYKVQLGYLASYLGISQGALSRLRASYKI